ncbi:methyltransferase domain-containing protein [Streptomyces sp. NPDC051976]|uniref:class I SAM-dependent methyltransferase n=1 Tax=Streptomyces sp. NPDC051976 TaxID=3154947 RepID=UPI0034159852
MVTFEPSVLAYYSQGNEDARLREGEGRLEFWRTQDVLRRALPAKPARILDVGGGSGVHAEWLVADGHDVEVVDPVPLHVEQAAQVGGVTARLGDARELPYGDGEWDVVLLLGPLYHLPHRADRIRALSEARRVARPGALVAAAQISRYAGLHDLLRTGRYFEPGRPERTAQVLKTGHLPAGGLFTDAYFHDPAEIADEFADAGLHDAVPHGLEGAAWLMGETGAYLDDPERRQRLLDALRSVETAPSVLGASGHILTTAHA